MSLFGGPEYKFAYCCMVVPPQEVPEAAALLASDDNAARDVPQLTALAYWAPSRLLQATALLTGRAGSHKIVRAYALRSLTTTATPEEVCLRLQPGPDPHPAIFDHAFCCSSH